LGTSPRQHVHRLQQITNQLQRTLASFGYALSDTPIIENADLFLTKAGDQLVEQLFTFSRSGRQLALRPEFTAAALYQYMAEQRHEAVRWQFIGPIFSDAPARATGQQHSVGAELIGSTRLSADAEILALAVQGAIATGVRDWTLVIGHAGLLRHGLERFSLEPRTRRFLLQHRAMLKDGVTPLLSALEMYLNTPFDAASVQGEIQAEALESVLAGFLDHEGRGGTMGSRTKDDIARRLLQKQRQSAQREQVEQAVTFLTQWGRIRGDTAAVLDQIGTLTDGDDRAQMFLADWRELIRRLGWYGVPVDQIVLQPDLALTWDYYTGIVFELHNRDGRSLAGGGRYDELARLMGSDRNIPAVGLAYHVDRWLDMAELVVADQPALRLITPDKAEEQAVLWAEHLRTAGLNVSLIEDGSSGFTQPDMIITADGLARYADRSYEIDELPQLLDALKGNHPDDR
jgi:histidyl-tRNA synthetase